MDLKKEGLKASITEFQKNKDLNSFDDIKNVSNLHNDVLEGHVHVIATLGIMAAIMNFTSKSDNFAFFFDSDNLYKVNVPIKNGMSFTRLVLKDNKFDDSKKYDKVTFDGTSKYKVIEQIKETHKIKSDADLRRH